MSTTANTTVEKFTPGPWKWRNAGDDFFPYQNFIKSGDRLVASAMGAHVGNSPEVMKANAKLIAAAPEMYAVLKELYDWSINNNVRGSIFPKLEAALKKATE